MKTSLALLIFSAALAAQTKPPTPAPAPSISDKARGDYFFAQWQLAQSRLDQIEREKAIAAQTMAVVQAINKACPAATRASDGDLACPAAPAPVVAKP